ncbi:MAG: hypothetical protein R3E79_15510 [Caldilineaceae bacterium]
MNLTKLSDEQLLQLVARRDADAFETLYDRHAQIVYNLILRINGRPAYRGRSGAGMFLASVAESR